MLTAMLPPLPFPAGCYVMDRRAILSVCRCARAALRQLSLLKKAWRLPLWTVLRPRPNSATPARAAHGRVFFFSPFRPFMGPFRA